MLHEYAFSPELLRKWAGNDRDYREFFREYGLGSPRLSSTFPKLKTSKFRSYFLRNGPVDEQSKQALRYTEMIDYLAEALIYRDGFECTKGEWGKDVIEEDNRNQFHAMISTELLDSPRSLTPENMYLENSVWGHCRQYSVPRRYQEIAPHLKNILRLAAKSVVIVDTFGWNERSIDFILHLVSDALSDRVYSVIPEIHLYFKEKYDKSNPTAQAVKSSIEQGLPGTIEKISLTVTELREKDGSDVFHNRCILTEHGGISLGHGIDVSEDINHTDEITLLEKDVYEKKWNQFLNGSCFEVVSQA